VTAEASVIQRILFPVDFSPACTAMAPYVKRAAEMFGAKVTLVHVFDLYSNYGFELIALNLREIAETNEAISRDHLRTFLESEFPPHACSRILRTGEAAAQIAGAAKDGAFDLIIMPTHTGRFRRMLLGSTTAKVLNDADCMVMTTQHAEATTPRPLEHRVWVCAIGLSQDSARVLSIASRAAAAVHARLSVVHAAREAAVEPARRRLAELLSAVGYHAEIRIATGPVKEALLDAARAAAADALIVGRAPRSGALGRMRDLTYSLIRDSPFPVLSV